MPKAKTKQASGGARLKASGKCPVLLGLEPSLHDALKALAKAERRPLTQFIILRLEKLARKISN